MVKISHYEVYTDRGDGWKLEDRFSSDQRYDAMRIAKEREAEKIAVKILKEDFDVQDNSYVETVEYVSLAGKKDKSGSDYSLKGGLAPTRGEYNIETQEPAGASNGQNVITAVFKLVAIIVFCLISAIPLCLSRFLHCSCCWLCRWSCVRCLGTSFRPARFAAKKSFMRRSFLTRPTPLS